MFALHTRARIFPNDIAHFREENGPLGTRPNALTAATVIRSKHSYN